MVSAIAEGKSFFYSSADGLRLHGRDYDPGPTPHAPVICLAGLTRSSDDFDRLARMLAFQSATPRRVICFDYRGRGQSDHDPDWSHYDLGVERADFLAGMALCGVSSAHFVGTSRGGLHVLVMAMTDRAAIKAVVLNDIGPVLEPDGLARIKAYVGRASHPRDLDEAVLLIKKVQGVHFTSLTDEEWRIFATTTFGTNEAELGARYDLELAHILDSFELDKPLPDMWGAFDLLRDTPLLTIRGENSDLLSTQTFDAMGARWDRSESVLVGGQGHAPLLLDPVSIDRIDGFLAAADLSSTA